jgi:hypothetical protein
MPLSISKQDLEPAIASHKGHDALTRAVTSASLPAAVISVFGRYIEFNGAFGAGLANLAGEIAARPDLFRDPDEPVRLLADRASEVAADFFHGAIDEFDDRLTPWRDTHRTLAQAMLKGMGAYLGYSLAELNDVIHVNDATRRAVKQVWEGYGVAAALEERRLFQAMGFHTGSEILADQEFTIIDRILRDKRPAMVAALEAMKVAHFGGHHNAYYWIHIHTSVEADHFEAAVEGVNKALRYYAGTVAPETIRTWILEGFAHFISVQGDFMAALGEPTS